MKPLSMIRYHLNAYREAVLQAWSVYAATMDAIKDADGTKFYRDREAKAADIRDTTISVARMNAKEKLNLWMQHIRENAEKYKQPAITEEGLRVVQMLKLKSELRPLTHAELKEAAATVADDTAALDLIRDIGVANDIPNGIVTTSVPHRSAIAAVDALTKWVNNTIAAGRFYETPETRCDAYYSLYSAHGIDTKAAQYDRSFADDDAMMRYVVCNDSPQMQAALNGECDD